MAAAAGTGMAGRRRAKDSAMAANMKARGVTRTTCMCPMCHKPTSLGQVQNHLFKCKGRS